MSLTSKNGRTPGMNWHLLVMLKYSSWPIIFGLYLSDSTARWIHWPLEWALLKAHFGHRVLNNPPNGRPHMSQLFQIMGDHDARFNNIALLVEIIMVLPMSSSVCERGFSSRIKTDWRSRLTTDIDEPLVDHLYNGTNSR